MSSLSAFLPGRRLLASLAALCAPVARAAGETPSAIGASQPAIGAGTALELILGLVLVIGAIVVTAWVARRMLHLRPGMNGQLRVLGGLSIGGRERVVLVQVGDKQLVLGVAPGRVQALHVMDQPVEPASTDAAGVHAAPAPTFATVLRRFAGARREGS